MESNTSIERLVEFCTGIALEFESSMNRIRNFVPDHNLTSGTANETILRTFLSQRASGRFGVCQGFICDPTKSDLVSKQCDIIVYDQSNYPLVHSEGEVKIVFPDSVKMLIEVKTTLDKKQTLKDALENIRKAKKMNHRLNGVIFAFQSSPLDTIINYLEQLSGQFSAEYAPNVILLLNRGIIIHRGLNTEDGGGVLPFEIRKCKDMNSGIVIAFLLLLFFDFQLKLGATNYNMMLKMLDMKTELLDKKVEFTG